MPACATEQTCGPAPYGNALATNVIVNATAVMTYPPAHISMPRGGFNVSNNLVTDDPGFADADPRRSLNFTLAPDSPAFQLGFQRIPMECFGPGKRCPGEPQWGADRTALVPRYY